MSIMALHPSAPQDLPADSKRSQAAPRVSANVSPITKNLNH